MRVWLVLMVIPAAIAFLYAYGIGSHTTYGFVWPAIFLSAACAVAGVVGALLGRAREYGFWAAAVFAVASFWAACHANARWPGGDDGPGIGWVVTVIPASFVAALLGVSAMAWRLLRLRRRGSES